MDNELDRCKTWIEAALEYSGGTHDFEDVVQGITLGTMQLWPTPKGCIVTEIVIYPKKKVLNVFLGGGELEQIMDMLRILNNVRRKRWLNHFRSIGSRLY